MLKVGKLKLEKKSFTSIPKDQIINKMKSLKTSKVYGKFQEKLKNPLMPIFNEHDFILNSENEDENLMEAFFLEKKEIIRLKEITRENRQHGGHQNLLKVYGTVCLKNKDYLVMENCHSFSFEQLS